MYMCILYIYMCTYTCVRLPNIYTRTQHTRALHACVGVCISKRDASQYLISALFVRMCYLQMFWQRA